MSNPLFKPLHAGVARLVVAVFVGLQGLSCGAFASEEFLVDNWRFDDDLPRDGIISMAQGKDGYLWVSSRFGLARFDGVRFAKFGPTLDSLFLGHHYASLCADRAGTVWIGTPGGGLLKWRDQGLTLCMPPGNPVFGPVLAGLTNAQGRDLVLTPDGRVLAWSNGAPQLVANASRWGEPVPSSLCQDRLGNVWFVTYQHKLVRVRGTNAEEMAYGTGDNQRNWIALQTDATGELWAGTHLGLGVWHGDIFEPIAGPVSPFPVDDLIAIPDGSAQSEQSPEARSRSAAGRLWVIGLGRVWLLEGGRWATNASFEPGAGLYETSPRIVDSQGNLWFTTTGTSLMKAGTDGSLTPVTPKDELPPGRVASLYEDREGSMWVGIEHAGLARLRKRYFAPIGTPTATKAPLVWAVIEDSTGAIWLGTEKDGLHRWQEGKVTQFSLGNSGTPGSVYSLCLDRKGTVWAGTGDKGVFKFENGKFVPVWEQPEPGWNKRVYVIYEDHLGRMWFGSGLGVFCWKDGSARRYLARDFEMGVARVICEDSSNRLWAGLSGGSEMRLVCLEGDQFVAQGTQEGLKGHDIFGLHADADGSVWIGTVGGGLWHAKDGKYTSYGSREGLPDNRVFSIGEDDLGNLWLGSPSGILRLNKQSVAARDSQQSELLNCLVFDRTDGLRTRECSGGSQTSIFRGRNGRLLFAMAEGAVALAPEQIQINTLAPTVLIEEVRVDGKPQEVHGESPFNKGPALPSSAKAAAASLSIGPGRHVVEFRYTATSLAAPPKVRFKCRLDGVDGGWREADKSRSALYSLTSPGSYLFHVTSCNNDGVWNESGVSVGLVLAPYPWQSLWFQVAAGGSILLTVGGSIRFLERRRIQRKLEQLEMQQSVERERARIARDIHDDLGASLTEIGLLSEFAQRDSTAAEQVKADVRSIAAKARASTRSLDEIVWAVNPRNDTLEGFVTYASAYAEEQLKLAGIRCRLDIASPLPARVLRADMRHHLFMAFKEALTNIVKHANASQVDIGIAVEPGQLTVSVVDDGCGFVGNGQEPPSRGNGLANMRERLSGAGGTFECESAPGKGTRVRLRMKLEEPQQ